MDNFKTPLLLRTILKDAIIDIGKGYANADEFASDLAFMAGMIVGYASGDSSENAEEKMKVSGADIFKSGVTIGITDRRKER